MERLLPRPGSVPGRGTPVRPAAHRSGGSHRRAARHPRRDGTGGPARLVRSRPAPRSAARFPRLPPERERNRSSSPGWTRPGSWSVSGTARSTRARSPATRSAFRTTRPGTGEPVWYGGGKLAADLTLPKLRARWADPHTHDPLAGSRGSSEPGDTRGAPRHGGRSGRPGNRRGGFLRSSARLRPASPPGTLQRPQPRPGHGIRRNSPRLHRPGRNAPLVRRWPPARQAHPPSAAERLGAASPDSGAPRDPRFSNPECAEIYRHAARQAAAATEHLRRCTRRPRSRHRRGLGHSRRAARRS